MVRWFRRRNAITSVATEKRCHASWSGRNHLRRNFFKLVLFKGILAARCAALRHPRSRMIESAPSASSVTGRRSADDNAFLAAPYLSNLRITGGANGLRTSGGGLRTKDGGIGLRIKGGEIGRRMMSTQVFPRRI